MRADQWNLALDLQKRYIIYFLYALKGQRQLIAHTARDPLKISATAS